jgi:hypothetical protein
MGRGALPVFRHQDELAAKNQIFGRDLRPDELCRMSDQRSSHFRMSRRSAGGPGRPQVLQGRHGQEHVRHRLLHAVQRRAKRHLLEAGPSVHGGLSDGSGLATCLCFRVRFKLNYH